MQDRRAQIQHRQRSTFESVGKGKGAAVAASLPASHYKEELAAANLLASLVDPSAGGSSAEDVAQLVASQVGGPGGCGCDCAHNSPALVGHQNV